MEFNHRTITTAGVNCKVRAYARTKTPHLHFLTLIPKEPQLSLGIQKEYMIT